MEDLGITNFDYLVNEAGGGHARNPSLELLPNPKPLFFEPKETGLLLSADGEDFFLAALQPRRVPLQYDLHTFSSRTSGWTTELALLEPPSPRYKDEHLPHRTDKVIALEGACWTGSISGAAFCSATCATENGLCVTFSSPTRWMATCTSI